MLIGIIIFKCKVNILFIIKKIIIVITYINNIYSIVYHT